jgi:hypothetical protein
MKVYRRFIFENGNVIDELLTAKVFSDDLTLEAMRVEGIGEFFKKLEESDEIGQYNSSRFYWASHHTVINLDKVVLIEIVKY